jgi:hypothetical protein
MGRCSPGVSRCGILTGLFGVIEMNERIFELAKQADLIQWDTLSSGAKTPDHESVVKAKKFAELIVRECNSKLDNIGVIDRDSRTIAMKVISEHFGVEE